MNAPRTRTPAGLTRFGLSRAVLQAAIAAELEQTEDRWDPVAIASAVAAAIDANNQELLRQLNQAWAPTEGAPSPDAEDVAPEP
jgi:hypothetical protein